MAKKRIEVDRGSGNVFADLGYEDAKERRLKVELAMEVNHILRQRDLAQAEAARALGILQPHVSDLVRYRLNRFSVERLMQFLTHLGKDVEIRIAERPARRARVGVQVLHIFRARAARGSGRAKRGLQLLAKAHGASGRKR